MKSTPELDALARQAEEAGGKVLRVVLSGDGPIAPSPQSGGNGPARQEFTVSGFRPPALNRLMRGKIRDRIRLSREARDRIALTAREAEVYRAFRVKRRVSLVITLSGRQRPHDVDAVWKALLDGLKHCGLIVDDSAAACELGPVSFERGPATSTRIILEDMEAL